MDRITAMWRAHAPEKFARAEAHGCYEECPGEAPSICVECCLPPHASELAALLRAHQFNERVDPCCACGWNTMNERYDDFKEWIRTQNLIDRESISAWHEMRGRYHAEHVAALVKEALQ